MSTKTKGPRLSLIPERTLRLRYIEPLTEAQRRKDGNPFFALRVPAELLRKFKAHAAKKKTEPTTLVRNFMARATGYKLEAAE